MRKQKLEQTEPLKTELREAFGALLELPQVSWSLAQAARVRVRGCWGRSCGIGISTVTFECLLQLFIQVGVASLADDCGCADFAHLQARPLFEFLVMSCSMPLPMSLHQSLHLHLAASVFAPFGQDRASLAHVVLGFAVGCRFSQHLSKEAHKALQGLRESRWSFLDTKCGFRQELKEPALDINSPLWLRS